jgi:hypothetical protein
MQENTTSSTTDSQKDLLFFTLLGLAVAIVSSVLFAILIHGRGTGVKTFAREPGALPIVTISVINVDDPAASGIVDVYCQLYYAIEDVNADDILISGIKLRTNAENGVLSLNPNLLGDEKGYLAIKVIEPHGNIIQEFEGSNMEIQQFANDNTILIGNLRNVDAVISDVAVQIRLAQTE